MGEEPVVLPARVGGGVEGHQLLDMRELSSMRVYGIQTRNAVQLRRALRVLAACDMLQCRTSNPPPQVELDIEPHETLHEVWDRALQALGIRPDHCELTKMWVSPGGHPNSCCSESLDLERPLAEQGVRSGDLLLWDHEEEELVDLHFFD